MVDPPDKGPTFLRLFTAAERRVYAYVYTLLPNRADADDVLQEASVVMWEKFDPAAPPDDFVAWGCRIAYYKVLDVRRRRARSRVLFSQDVFDRLAETAAEHADALQLDARGDALADCLDRLPKRDRELLARRFADGATVASTAAAVGRSADAVYKALAKIRYALHECIDRKVTG